MKLQILYAGQDTGTSRQRMLALRDLGHEVRSVACGPPRGFWAQQLFRLALRAWGEIDLRGANRAIQAELRRTPADLLWIDKGLSLQPRTLAAARRLAPGIVLVSYSPDDMLHPAYRQARYRATLARYDLHVTTKTYNVPELRGLGARDVLFVANAFDPAMHRPLELSPQDRARYAADVGFVGTFEEDRAHQLLGLARAGIEVSVWGEGWRRFGQPDPRLRVRDEELPGLEYAKAINATQINLGFLRKSARDRQTTRSVEIPACAAFMLAERTEEHLELFVEGREAEFFDSFEELLAKCRFYGEHQGERQRIAAAGRQRCLDGGYSNQRRLAGVLAYLTRAHGLAAGRRVP